MKLGYEYIAAFIDCDGSISIVRQHLKLASAPQYFCKVGFYSQNLSTLQDIKDTVGGRISLPKRHACYQLQLGPRETVGCLKRCKMFLRIKGEQAGLAIRLQEDIKANSVKGNFRTGRRVTPQSKIDERHAMFLEMKRLNHVDSQALKTNRVNSVKALNGRVTPSEAAEGKGSAERVTTSEVSPNNNLRHEDPTRKGRHSLDSTESTEKLHVLKCG